jgi:hypothetical protein
VVEFGGDDCRVTLTGRLIRLQQVTAEMSHQLQEREEPLRAAAGHKWTGTGCERRATLAPTPGGMLGQKGDVACRMTTNPSRSPFA